MAFCPECGAEQIKENPKFCYNCGAAFEPRKPAKETEHAQEREESTEPTPATAAPMPAQDPAPDPGKSPNYKVIAIAALIALAVALVVIVALAITSPKAAEDSSAEEPSESGPSLSTEEMRDFFVGKWVAQDSSDETLSESWFKKNAAEGIYITLTLWDDGTGAFRTDGGPVKLTWEAESATSATASTEDDDLSIELRGKKLTMTNSNGLELYFVPEDQVDMSNAVDLTHQGMGVTVDPSSIYVEQYSKLIGNESVGYMQIPQGWENRVSDLKSDWAKTYAAVYYVDATTEYTSPTQGGYAFAQSVQMSRHSESYIDLAEKLTNAYESDSNYGDTAQARMTIGKRRAICIMSSNKEDNLDVMSIVIDRDNDEKVSVVLSFNCGATGSDKGTEWALAFASSWQVE